MQATVHGYRYSVYTHILRMGLRQKSVNYSIVWVDPFAEIPDPALLALHPFGRVPVLTHGDFTLYETAVILRYVDQAFSGADLTPTSAKAAARMAQVISIADNYAYWPLVRQVFSHSVFRPAAGEVGDETEIKNGLAVAPKVLAALETIAHENLVLNGGTVTLADIHLAPMIGSFVQAPEGLGLLRDYPALLGWWESVAEHPSYLETIPGLPNLQH